ncbi:MAG: AMP-binding protein [Bacillota bacterium]|nr:AMP-binding protein [Bacillota bacterium]
MSLLERTKDLLDVFIEQTDTIPQMLYNIQVNLGLRPANMFKEDGEWKVITYNELVNRVENIAIGLMQIGVQSEDFVGIKAHTCARWAWADLGLLFAGAVSTSVYPSLSKKQTVEIATHCEMKWLMLGDRELLFDTLKYKDEMPGVKALICMEKGFVGNGEDIFGLDELMQLGADNRQDCCGLIKERLSSLTADSPAILVYTSGTTADLKGVLHSHKDILWASYRGQKGVALHKHSQNYNTVAMSVLPMSHILEKINSYYGPLSCGAMIGYVDSPATILSDIQAIKPTWITLVPRLVSRIYLGFERAFSATEIGKKAWDWAMDVALRATYALENEHGVIDTTIPFEDQLNGSLREEWIAANNNVYSRIKNALGGRVWDITIGGSVLEAELQRKFTGMGGWALEFGYGSTESTSCMAQSNADCARMGWTGELDPGTEAKLADDGELLIRGHGIITSYYKNPAANAKSFTEDGWFKTGDIAEFDESRKSLLRKKCGCI